MARTAGAHRDAAPCPGAQLPGMAPQAQPLPITTLFTARACGSEV